MAILYLGSDPSRYPHTGPLVHYPVIQTVQVQRACENTDACTHWVFTSPQAVRYWAQGAQVSWRTKTVLAVGPATSAALRERGVVAEQAPQATQEGVIEWLASKDLCEAFIGWPRSALARPVLETYLREQGIRYLAIDLYTTVTRRAEPVPDLSLFDELVFTSPSTVRAFVEIFGAIPSDKKLTPIGPVTRAALFEAVEK